MEYITSYLIVKGNVLEESRLWLRQIHLPYTFLEEEDVLIIFNINKDYLAEFIRRFNPSDWQYDSAFDSYPIEYQDVFHKATRILCANLTVYTAYNRKDATAGPFTNPLDDEKKLAKAFNGTGYQAWKTRWYLCRDGLCEGQFDDALTDMVRARYSEILNVAGKNTQTEVQGLKIDIYYDYTTFYIGWFVDYQGELSYDGVAEDLKPLNAEMKRLIAEQGLERNLYNRCGIPLYLKSMGLPHDYKRNLGRTVNTVAGSCGLLGFDSTYNVRGDEEVKDWAVIRLKESKLLRQLQHIDYIPIIALDRDHNKIVLGNVGDSIYGMMDLSSSITYSRTHSPEEYSQLVADVKRQMEYNKSLPFMQTLKDEDGRYNLDKLYEGMRWLNANSSDRKIIEDEPHRVEYLQHDKDEEVAAMVLKYFKGKYGDGIKVDYRLKANFYSRLVEAFMTLCSFPDDVAFSLDEVCQEWATATGFGIMTTEQAQIVKFFRYLLANIPELNKYFRII